MTTALRTGAQGYRPRVGRCRSIVEEALLDAALDTIAPFVSEECRADRCCLANLVEGAVREATDRALEALEDGLSIALAETPPELSHRIEMLLIRAELGHE
jgi:hypothetical protein